MSLMKDFDIRIRNGGDDAIAAVAELWEARERILFDITDAFTKARWIPVEERLLESGETVLVWHHGEVQMAWLNHFTNGVAYFVRDTHYNFEPTHWMPLPEPPEVG